MALPWSANASVVSEVVSTLSQEMATRGYRRERYHISATTAYGNELLMVRRKEVQKKTVTYGVSVEVSFEEGHELLIVAVTLDLNAFEAFRNVQMLKEPNSETTKIVKEFVLDSLTNLKKRQNKLVSERPE